ncbi:MAG: hypothetical protein ACRDGV_11485 [Candidatus Limnocylindria bacterium]
MSRCGGCSSAYRTTEGLCESVELDGGSSGGGCAGGPVGLPPNAVHTGITGGSDQPTFVSGQVGADVARVVIETRFDGEFEAVPFDAPPELELPTRFLIVALPEASTVLRILGFDADGVPIEEQDFGLSP